MNIGKSQHSVKKTALSIALAAMIAPVTSTEAAVFEFSFDGLWTFLDGAGSNVLGNNSAPYYYDPTWGKGKRTQITGTLTFDSISGNGTATINSFEFFSGSLPAEHVGITLQAIGDGFGNPGNLVMTNMLFNWNGTNGMPVAIVWDAAGLISYTNANPSGGVFGDVVTGGATPASDAVASLSAFPIGSAPLATTTWDTTPLCNTAGPVNNSNCLGVNPIGALPLLADSLAGTPMMDGPFSGSMTNIDITSMTLTSVGNKVGLLRARSFTAFSTIADPSTVYPGLGKTVGNLVAAAKSHGYPINFGTSGSQISWVELANNTTETGRVTLIRSYQTLSGFNGLTIVTTTGGNTCTVPDDPNNCEPSTGPDSFMTVRPTMVNVAAKAVIGNDPVRWQKFCTNVFNNASLTVEIVCGHGAIIEVD